MYAENGGEDRLSGQKGNQDMKRFATILYVLALLVALGAFGLLLLRGYYKSHRDPVKSFQDVMAEYELLTNEVCFVGATEDSSFNVMKTDSLVTPVVAVMNYSKQFTIPSGNVRLSLKVAFALQERKWVCKGVDYEDNRAVGIEDLDRLHTAQECETTRWKHAAMLVQ
jgi:hypothetical protein